VADGLRARRATYRSAPVDPDAVRVVVAPDASAAAIVVEVFAPDAIGVLATLARAFADAGLDVMTVRAATTDELAVDVFYVRDDGTLHDADRVTTLQQTLRETLARD
jgi:UTP:GlnB (protein PII) uridylyltransferase